MAAHQLNLPPDDLPGEPGRVPFVDVDPKHLPAKRLVEPADLGEYTNEFPFRPVLGQRVYVVHPNRRASLES